MHITKSKRPTIQPYSMHSEQLEVVHQSKYLGVTINEDLKWNHHINNVVSSANKIQGMLNLNIKRAPKKTKITAVNTLVRPKVEYAAAIWDPYTQDNINKLEGVQRRAARYVYNNYSHEASVTSMLNQLKWKSLQERRQNIRLCWFYRIVYGLVAIPVDTYLTPMTKTIKALQHHGLHHLQSKI